MRIARKSASFERGKAAAVRVSPYPSSFGNDVSRASSLGRDEYPGVGMVREELLFPAGVCFQ